MQANYTIHDRWHPARATHAMALARANGWCARWGGAKDLTELAQQAKAFTPEAAEILDQVMALPLSVRRALGNYIAAAPDLYEALRRIIEHHGAYINELPGEFGINDMKTARAALARARPTQQGE